MIGMLAASPVRGTRKGARFERQRGQEDGARYHRPIATDSGAAPPSGVALAQCLQPSVLCQLTACARLTRRLPPAAINWTLIAYALVLCVGIWGLVVQRIQSDYHSTLETEREHLRSVSGTLQAQVEAMLGD